MKIKIKKINNNCKKMSDYLLYTADIDFIFYDYRLCGFTVNEVMCHVKNLVENRLPEMLEICPVSIFDKAIQVHKLKKRVSFFCKRT